MQCLKLMLATLAGFCALGQAYQVAVTAPSPQEAGFRFLLTCLAAGMSIALFRNALATRARVHQDWEARSDASR